MVLHYFNFLVQQYSDFSLLCKTVYLKTAARDLSGRKKELILKCKLLQLKGCSPASVSFCDLYPKNKNE